MHYVLLVCVDSAWGYARKDQLPWSIPEEKNHYSSQIKKPQKQKKAFIFGKKTWLSASKTDKKIMANSICCLISKSYQPTTDEPILQFPSITEAKAFLESPENAMLETVFIIGGKEIYLETMKNNWVQTLIISRLNAQFECDSFLSEMQSYLSEQFNCLSKTRHSNPDSIDFIVEEWSHIKKETYDIGHRAYGLEFSLQLKNQSRPCPWPQDDLLSLLKLVIDSVHQYCNAYFPQREVIQLIACNVLKIFEYFLGEDVCDSLQIHYQGQCLYSSKINTIIERTEQKTWGWVDVLCENASLNTAILCIKKQASIKKHYHVQMLERECLVVGAVNTYYEEGPLTSILPLCQFNRPPRSVHGYLNTGTETAKILSIDNKLFKIGFEVLSPNQQIPKKLKSKSLNCLMVGSTGGIGQAWYEAIKAQYNVICLDKRNPNDGRFHIPLDFRQLDSIFHVKNGLQQIHMDLVVIASGIYSFDQRKQQQCYVFEETIQVNYLGPIFLLLELIHQKIIDHQTQIVVLSSSKYDPNSPYQQTTWSSHVTPKALLAEPADYHPDRQYGRSKFALNCSVSQLSKLGFNIVAINPGFFPKTQLFRNQTAKDHDISNDLGSATQQFLALLKQKRFAHCYEDFQDKKPLSNAVLDYDCSKLWDYSLSLYFKWAQLPQKICRTTWHPLRFLTWNILGIKSKGKSLHLSQRMNYLLQELYYDQPDIVCLQEITKDIWTKYLKPFAAKYSYRLSEMPADIASCPDRVFVTTLSRLFVLEEQLIELQKDSSGKDYYCLYQRYEQFDLMNVHLLSGAENQEKRQAQMQQILSSTPIREHCILLGDFNSDLNQTDLALSQYGFVDVWKKQHPKQTGYTEDYQQNLLRKEIKKNSSNHDSRRVDGIFVQSALVPAIHKVHRIGLEERRSQQFISDHYGLSCTIHQLWCKS